jgi:hypothetical protein
MALLSLSWETRAHKLVLVQPTYVRIDCLSPTRGDSQRHGHAALPLLGKELETDGNITWLIDQRCVNPKGLGVWDPQY